MPHVLRTYEQAIDYLYSRINYERVPAGSYTSSDLKLERMQRLLQLIGSPHERIPAVHIAGTKGKGSTAVMVAEILAAAGYTTGLFTSPHVQFFEERMRVDGSPPKSDELVDLVNRVKGPVESVDRFVGQTSATYFEIATALAWLYFADRGVDIVVLEVGLGGRLDATNLCRPAATAITNISHDHTALLGDSLAEIAKEKAGIIKPGVPVVSGVNAPEARDVIAATSATRRAPLHQVGREIRFHAECASPPEPILKRPHGTQIDVEAANNCWRGVPVPLVGEHQIANAALAVGVVDVLDQRGWPVSPEAVRAGMENVRWPIRFEVLSQRPTVIADAAHNPASAAALLRTLNEEIIARRRILVFAASKDKDVPALLRELVPWFDEVMLTRYVKNPRAMGLDELHEMASEFAPKRLMVANDPSDAWDMLRHEIHEADVICVTGSFFLAAEMREIIVGKLGQMSDRVPGGHSATSRWYTERNV